MADAKHTPGPWHVSGEDVGRAQHYLHIGARTSAMVLASMNEIHNDTPANACLIAAAPELLSMLSDICAQSDAKISTHGVREKEAEALYQRARALIAKATGSAS